MPSPSPQITQHIKKSKTHRGRSKEPFFLSTIGWWNNHFHVHIFILKCLRLVSTLFFKARFDLSHKRFHVRTMLYTEGSVQKTYLKPRGAIYDILLTYSKFKMQHIVCMCDPNVYTNIKRIWVLFNEIHFWTWSKVLKYQNKTSWESYIFDLPSHQTWNTWRWKRWKKCYQTWIKLAYHISKWTKLRMIQFLKKY